MPYKNPERKRQWEREHRGQRNAARRKQPLPTGSGQCAVPKPKPDPSSTRSGDGWKVLASIAVGIGVVLLECLLEEQLFPTLVAVNECNRDITPTSVTRSHRCRTANRCFATILWLCSYVPRWPVTWDKLPGATVSIDDLSHPRVLPLLSWKATGTLMVPQKAGKARFHNTVALVAETSYGPTIPVPYWFIVPRKTMVPSLVSISRATDVPMMKLGVGNVLDVTVPEKQGVNDCSGEPKVP